MNDKQKPKNAHNNLVRWVKEYFVSPWIPDGDIGNILISQDHDRARVRPEESAFNVMMRTSEGGSGRGDSTRSSSRFPLVLQVNWLSEIRANKLTSDSIAAILV